MAVERRILRLQVGIRLLPETAIQRFFATARLVRRDCRRLELHGIASSLPRRLYTFDGQGKVPMVCASFACASMDGRWGLPSVDQLKINDRLVE